MKEFEREIIRKLLSSIDLIDIELPKNPDEFTIEFTGVCYYLEFRNNSLPKHRIILNRPLITGTLNGIEVGYLGFIENSEFTLECYTVSDSLHPDCRQYEFKPSYNSSS